jgi:cobyric acid synthase
MLGDWLLDPDEVESATVRLPGLGLLPLSSTFGRDKRLTRAEAIWLADGTLLKGYEIHHGITVPSELSRQKTGMKIVARSTTGEALGYGDGRVWGTYIHGIFDADGFRRGFLNELRTLKGLPPLAVHPAPNLDDELDRLAEAVLANVDLARIEKDLGL